MDILVKIIPALLLITLSGLFSGLTLGLMGLDPYELERKARLGNRYAAKIFPLRRRGNELLAALLLGNAAINSALSIFLSSLTTGVIAGVLSTVLIFVFGEVIPQASISRHALKFGAAMAPLVSLLLFITYPLTKPFGMLLDRLLGKEMQTMYSKQELSEIITEHESSTDGVIDSDEKRIIIGALRFSEKKAKEIMTPRVVVFTLQKDAEINGSLLEKLRHEGYSRVPVYSENIDRIEGVLHVKELLGMTSGKVSDYMRPVMSVDESMRLDDLKNMLIQSHQHVAIVSDEFGGFSGIVTLEDVLEEVIGSEIMDEGDTDADLQTVARASRTQR